MCHSLAQTADLAYVAVGHDGIKRLWIRRLDATGEPATEIAGTENANTPFWSPDSAWIGFFNRHGLLKVRPTDRRVRPIAKQASAMAGATWNADGVIVFAGGIGGLSRVSAEGGPVAPVTAGEGSHFWPQFIGDGRHFVYAALIPREIRLGSLTGEPSRALMKFPSDASSLVYARGYLFFGSGSRLFARAFDEATLEFVGESIDLLESIPRTQLGRMPFSVSADGPLAVWPYLAGTPATLQWLTETGVTASVVETPARYLGLALAPTPGGSPSHDATAMVGRTSGSGSRPIGGDAADVRRKAASHHDGPPTAAVSSPRRRRCLPDC